LGRFDLYGIPPAPRGVPQIEVTFDLDVNGILHVSALDKSTGKSNRIQIKNEKGRLSQSEIQRMLDEAKRFEAEDLKQRERVDSRNKLEQYLYQVANPVNLFLQKNFFRSKIVWRIMGTNFPRPIVIKPRKSLIRLCVG